MLVSPQVADFLYCCLLLSAFGIGMAWTARRMRRMMPVGGSAIPLLLCVFVGGLVGAKALWVIEYSSISDLWQEIAFWHGGLVYYGGLAGGILAIYAYANARPCSVLGILDAAAPCVALGEAIARIGCLIAGCCWGAVTSVPWGIRYPNPSHAFQAQASLHMIGVDQPESLPVHPTQIYLMIGVLAIVVLLMAVERRKRFDGQLLFSYMLFYGIIRAFVEIFRDAAQGGDSVRVARLVTVSQAMSLGLIVLGLGGLHALSRRAAGHGKELLHSDLASKVNQVEEISTDNRRRSKDVEQIDVS